MYRISSEEYAHSISGQGAALFGGRWNPKDVPLLYCSKYRSLAYCELLAHLRPEWTENTYMLLTIQLPDDCRSTRYSVDDLPEEWNALPPRPSSKLFGMKFLSQCKDLFIEVPSVFIEEECNVLINPLHPDFKQVRILNMRPLNLDGRHL